MSKLKPRNKQTTQPPAPSTELIPTPKLTPELAMWFVKLLHAGLPGPAAVSYILPDCPTPSRVAANWANSELTVAATVAFTRGKWEDLEPDARLIVARDKFLAEQAFYLYTHSFNDLEAEDRGKAKYAYQSIVEHLKNIDTVDDPVTRFMAEMAKKLSATVTVTDVTDDVALDPDLPMH